MGVPPVLWETGCSYLWRSIAILQPGWRARNREKEGEGSNLYWVQEKMRKYVRKMEEDIKQLKTFPEREVLLIPDAQEVELFPFIHTPLSVRLTPKCFTASNACSAFPIRQCDAISANVQFS
tara:strand:+ start:2635 stop:3000 length:366 start_codon:yes stop_codon:yes gene_type:complete